MEVHLAAEVLRAVGPAVLGKKLMLIRLFTHFINIIGPRTFIILGLLLLALGNAASTLAHVIQGPGLNLLLVAMVIGLTLGWILAGFKPLPDWLTALIISILGFEILLVRVGHLEVIGLKLGPILFHWGKQLGAWIWFKQELPDNVLLQQTLLELWSNLSILLLRLANWGQAIITGEPTFDPVAAALVWGLIMWLVSAWAGWVTHRLARPLVALAPLTMLLATVLAYRPKDSPISLIIILATILLLMPLVGHRNRERRWQVNALDFASTIQTDLLIVVIPIATILLFMAILLPSIPIRQITRYTYRLFEQQSEQTLPLVGSLGLEPRPLPQAASILTAIQSPGLPRQHLLGTGEELSEQITMIIDTNQPAPGFTRAGVTLSSSRYYWRSLTYDIYTGQGWKSKPTEAINHQAGEVITSTAKATPQILQQQVQLINKSNGLLYTAGELISVDRDYVVNQRHPQDIFAITLANVNNITTYHAQAFISTPNAQQLRTTGNNYPNWVRNEYLRLPNSLPERVLTLARDLTATAPTPYDRAKAIESYLRTYPYSLNLPPPPRRQDMVDYFLFDLQQGYCDYYATSMVVLARAAGLPARLAIGYANGTYNRTQDHYIVTEADAHSWVEVYFPGYGWIEFEPTAAQPVSDHGNEIVPPDIPNIEANLTSSLPQNRGVSLLLWFFGGLLLLLGSGMGWSFFDRWRLHHLTPTATVNILYKRLYNYGPRLTVPTWAGDTPLEFSATFTRQLETLLQGKYQQRLLTPAIQQVNHLTTLYMQAAYSDQMPNITTQQQAIQTWHRLRWRLWLAWFLKRIRH